jgi:CBS domain-containing protein
MNVSNGACAEEAMRAKDIMTRDPITIAPDASVMQAVRLMLQHRISSLPVVAASGTLVGILAEGDLLRRGELGINGRRPRWIEFLIGSGQFADEYMQACGRKVYEIMSRQVFTASEETTTAEIVYIMKKRGIHRLPIVQGGKLVGIVTRSDLVRALARVLRSRKPQPPDDASMRSHLMAELNRHTWAPSRLINVVILDGVIQLWGVITEEGQRNAIRVAAENTPGAKAVEDHLMLVQPTAFGALMS